MYVYILYIYFIYYIFYILYILLYLYQNISSNLFLLITKEWILKLSSFTEVIAIGI